MTCNNCKTELPKEGDFISCLNCNFQYHYGCASISKSTWKGKSKSKKAEWKCPNCRKVDTIESKDATETDDSTFKILKNLLEKMFQNHEKVITDRIDSLNNVITNMQDQLKSVLNQVKDIDAATSNLKSEIESLKITVETEKQYSRSKNFVINGIPVKKDENIVKKVSDLLSSMKIYHNLGEMTIHRLPSKTEDFPIFVQCYSRGTRDYIVRTARKARPKLSLISNSAENKPIYFNDHTTPYFTQLMIKAKSIKKEKNYKFIWLDGNKIMMKKDDNARPIRINSDKDFDLIQ